MQQRERFWLVKKPLTINGNNATLQVSTCVHKKGALYGYRSNGY